ncbi:MAG: ABC transporter permease [Nitrospirae bacterium]|nr:MAG: ABC transporter permease [Nitrospirota bacterium]
MVLFLYAPVGLLIVFSFNASPMSVAWQGFSWHWYDRLLSDRAMWEAAQNSLAVATVSSVLAVAMGIGAALVLERRPAHARGMEWVHNLLLLPLMIPEVLLGVALLLFFVIIEMPLGLITVMIGHVVFNLPLAIVVLRARLRKIDPFLDEAARDLGATPWQTFRWITIPLLRPAILSAGLMAFTVSLDDFIVTFFTAGPGATTLPLRVFSMIKTGITPEVNALSALLVTCSMAFIGLSLFVQHREARPLPSQVERT